MSEVMREYVSRRYSKQWVANMPDNQVVCIYRRLLDKEENDKRKREREQRKEEANGIQGNGRS